MTEIVGLALLVKIARGRYMVEFGPNLRTVAVRGTFRTLVATPIPFQTRPDGFPVAMALARDADGYILFYREDQLEAYLN